MTDEETRRQNHYRKMTESPVQGLIIKLAVPTIISMLVSSIYNMADTYFVSKLGTSAAGAVGVVFSVMAIIQAVGFTIGMGGGVITAESIRHHHGIDAVITSVEIIDEDVFIICLRNRGAVGAEGVSLRFSDFPRNGFVEELSLLGGSVFVVALSPLILDFSNAHEMFPREISEIIGNFKRTEYAVWGIYLKLNIGELLSESLVFLFQGIDSLLLLFKLLLKLFNFCLIVMRQT